MGQIFFTDRMQCTIQQLPLSEPLLAPTSSVAEEDEDGLPVVHGVYALVVI